MENGVGKGEGVRDADLKERGSEAGRPEKEREGTLKERWREKGRPDNVMR